MFWFVDNHPVISSVIVTVLFLSSILFELWVLHNKGLAILSFLMGGLGIVACLSGAMRSDEIYVLAVQVILGIYVIASAYCWWRHGNSNR